MTKLPLIAFTAIVAAAGIAGPVFAATTTSAVGNNVPYCSSGSEDLAKSVSQLSDQLQLSTKQDANIDVWNGCLKVILTHDGVTTVSFYDPNSLSLVAQI